MSMSGSSKPTPTELNSSLGKLVNWEQVALHLPKIDTSVIEIIIKEKPSNVAGQKLALWTKWLNMYPEGTWEDVISALEKAEEIALAKSLTHAYCRSVKKHTTIHEFGKIVIELQEMQDKFEDIAAEVEIKCKSLISSGELHLFDLTTRLRNKESTYSIYGITKVETVEDFFDKLTKGWNFLDCELLKLITEKMPDTTDLVTKINVYMERVKVFMKENSEIESLKNKIYPLIDQSILANCDTCIFVVFKLQDAWSKKAINVVDILVQTLFPHNKMEWYKIRPGSVCITLIAHEQISEHLISTSKHKLVFMRLVGIFNLQIGTTTVLEGEEIEQYSFELSFLEASTVGNLDALKFLLLIGVCIDYQNQEGQTALMIASKHGHKEIVKYLLSAEANVNNVDKTCTAQSALILASENNDIAIAQLLLEAKANPNHQREDGSTSLHIACYREYEELALLLIGFGADPLIKNSESDTPFFSSVKRNMLKIVKLISPNLTSSELSSALLIACRLGHPEMISSLLQLIDCTSKSFHMFCANGDLAQVAQEIVQFSSDVNSAIVLGITPLMIASSCGHVEVVECLIQAEADINSTDQDGYSPLAYAITGSKSIAVVECLLQAGANTFIRVRDVILLQMAKEKCQSDMTHLLLQYMALQLYNMFSSVVDKIQRDLSNDIKENKVTLQEIVSRLQNSSQFKHINGITRTSNCLELFSCLKPHYNFLSWKIISFLSDRLKEERYFTFVEIFEEAVKLANFSNVLLLLSHEEEKNSHPSNYSEITLTLEKAWDRKSLFNLRSLIAFLFSSTACVMSHLTVIHSSQMIVVKYRIPRSDELTETLKSIVSKKQVSVAILGIVEIAIDSESVFSASLNYTFTFESAAWYAARSSEKLSSDELVKLLKFLFKLGEVNPNIVVANRTPLLLCVFPGNFQAVNVLLQNGASPHIGDSDGECTPLMLASYMGHFEIAKSLICTDQTIVNKQTNRQGTTALMFASFKGHIEIVHLLLQKGSEPNMAGFKGETALIAASQEGYTEIVHLLLEAGVDPNVLHSNSKTALMFASNGGHSEVVKLLLAHHADYTASVTAKSIQFDSFGCACLSGNKETVDVFLNDANLSPTSLSLGWYIACLFNKTHLIEYLVHSLPEILSEQRQLIVACVEDKNILSRFHKFFPDITFVHGVTLLMIACSCGHSSIVTALVDAGANVHQTDSFGFQAIDYCKKDSPMYRLPGIQWNEKTVKKHFNKEEIHLFQDVFLYHKKGFDDFEMPIQDQSSLAY